MTYDIIYADPPWWYNDKQTAGKRGAGFKYPCMKLHELKQICVTGGRFVPEIASENSACLMWVTGPMMPVGLSLMSAWGFRFTNVAFTWVKTTKTTHKEWAWGMGFYTRSNPEFVLLGIRGKVAPMVESHSVHSVVKSPVMEHSQKPNEVRNRIVELLGDRPRIELFARQRVEGWDAHGDQVPALTV